MSTGNLALSTVGLVAAIACVPFETVTWNKTKVGCYQITLYMQSNHPPSVLKNIGLGINKHFSMLSSNQDFFDQAVPMYGWSRWRPMLAAVPLTGRPGKETTKNLSTMRDTKVKPS